jgi:hypothetical protein
MQTIIKMEGRIEVTPPGARRTVYRRVEYHPGHPDYEKEKKLSDEYLKTKTGQKYFTPSQMTFTPAARKI